MKKIIKKIIFKILKIEAMLTLWRYKPQIIAVTGSVGKTTAKDAIFQALSGSLHIRKNNKSLNSEIGVPLTILGLESGWNNIFCWIRNIIVAFLQIIYVPSYPKWLVIEVGIDRPGDMKKTASWLKPTIVVITTFGTVPSHVEFFESPEDVMREKAQLLNYLKENGTIILNADDGAVLKLKSKIEHKVYTYGKDNEKADILASNFSIVYDDKNNKPTGISFKVNYSGATVPINLNNVVGDQYIYPILAALSVGLAIDLSWVNIVESLNKFIAPPGRMNLLSGKNDTILIDDSYNASPLAMNKAVNVLSEIKTTKQRIAVLGDMAEIGRFSANEHRKLGTLLQELKVDIIITIGYSSKLINEQAIEDGMAKSRNFHFDSAEHAIEKVCDFLKPGNVLLIKGSQIIRTEKIIKKIMANPQNSKKLLVRQEKEWLSR